MTKYLRTPVPGNYISDNGRHRAQLHRAGYCQGVKCVRHYDIINVRTGDMIGQAKTLKIANILY